MSFAEDESWLSQRPATNAILDIPEVRALDARQHLIRIPQELDVPLTPRVRQLIDTAEFRRLARISQLGLVSLVYPAAHHSRFEHSLGVYRMALLYLRQLAYDSRFAATIRAADAERLIVAALLHDIGHWPFCHPIEDIRLPGVPRHERFAEMFVFGGSVTGPTPEGERGEIASILRTSWGVEPAQVLALLNNEPTEPSTRILHSILSGPIDIDKMDYLVRDSLHAGVPYGQNFDQQRLIGSLCLNSRGDGLAIADKGRTAAEMMVFARYVMFSEVYWHHAVRAATAMLQRAFFLLHHSLPTDLLLRMTEEEMIRQLQASAQSLPAGDLLSGLFGPVRALYKRLEQYSFFQQREIYEQLARRPYPWLVACAEEFAGRLAQRLRIDVAPHHVLIDAPPVQREVEFDVEIYFPKEDCYRTLGEVSPVVQVLARKQFDDYVKRVRIFVHPRIRQAIRQAQPLEGLILEAIQATR